MITSDNIEQYISRQVDTAIEFKYGTVVADVIGKIICGFANTAGGVIIFGYSEKKQRVYGCSSTDEGMIERVISSIENQPRYEKYDVYYQNHRLVITEIKPNEEVLSFYKGIAYAKDGNIYQALNGAELKERLSMQSDKYIDLLPQMQNNLIELNNKINEYEIGLANSDRKALIYCIAGIVGGAILSNIPNIISLLIDFSMLFTQTS